MREPRVNRAYVDPVVCLAEHPNPNAGRKKWVRGLEELEGPGLINAVPLQVIRIIGVDRFGPAGEDATGPASKKVSRATGASQEVSSSMSCSSTTLQVAPWAGAAEVVASSFGIASMSRNCPPGRLRRCTVMGARIPGWRRPTLLQHDRLASPPRLFCCALLHLAHSFSRCTAWIIEGGSGGGDGSGVRGSIGGFGAGRDWDTSAVGLSEGVLGAGRAEVAAGASGAMGIADVGPLCTLDFNVSPRAVAVCEEVAHFATLSCLSELFQRMPVDKMFRCIEANTARVSLGMPLVLLYSCSTNGVLCADLDAVVRAQGGYLARLHRDPGAALAEKARGLESRVAELEGEWRTLQEEMEALRGVRTVLEVNVAVEQELSTTVSRATWESME